MSFILAVANGLIELPWWGYLVTTLVLTHITIAGVTIYLHRHQAHRALELHPIISHFFRFWLWLTTGMVTREWAAVHRKHHAKVETPDDPHSPMVFGLKKVMWEGAELYRKGAADPEIIAKYGHGTPDDWVERNVYSKHTVLGIAIMLGIDLVLFGVIGLTIWAVQMAWIPFFAAGVINGLGHHSGYRNFQTDDTSTNILPWGILVGGEELHNNHHAYGTSAKLSSKWYEFDIGWMYIRIMEMLRLAEVRRLAPRVLIDAGKANCDLQTLQAVITHRYDVAARFGRTLMSTWRRELETVKANGSGIDTSRFKRWLQRGDLKADERADLEEVVKKSKVLETIYSMRQELAALWARSSASKEQLLHQLEDWCKRAEQSGIAGLRDFSKTLRGYAVPARA
ncbi:MAG TPA: fatty acid desaturase [Burkholderiales bacterium]|nr:fatty acid desaturase [Burkholderiales bacterium]